MKKILGFMLCLAVCAGTATMEAKDYKKALQKQAEKAEFDAQKALIKARSKQCDQKIKQYEKEGWKIDGTAKSIRVAMMEYYNKLNFDENYREMIGVAQCGTAKSRNVCQNGRAEQRYGEVCAGGEVARVRKGYERRRDCGRAGPRQFL